MSGDFTLALDPVYKDKRMGWGQRPALLVLDVCKAWWTPGSPVDISMNPHANESVKVMKALVEAARKGSVPVVWSKMEYTHPDMADAGLFYKKAKYLEVFHVNDSRKLFEPLSDFAPGPDDLLVLKQYPSAFFGTTLASTLRSMDVDSVVICGVTTSGAVRPTALEANGLGFRPQVVAAACGDKTQAQHDSNCFDLMAKYADVVGQADAIARLEAGWLK